MITIYIIFALLLFGFLVFIHELGHFVVARLCKVKVNEFAIGMGPKIFSRVSKKSNIRYSVRALPIGGYVSMEGEGEASDDKDALCNKNVWQRIAITAAGPFMNLVLGFLLMAVLVTAQGNLASTTISKFASEGISYVSGLKVGDTIVEIDGTKVHTGNEVVYEIMMQGYEPIDVVVIRNGEKKTIYNVAFPTDVQGGIAIGLYDFMFEIEARSFSNIIKHAWFRSLSTVKMVWDSLYGLLSGRYGVEAVSGPIGVTQQITDVAKTGDMMNVLYLFIVISINLGVMNLIPIPALDGGHLLFYILEIIAGKPIVNRDIENYIHAIFLILLLVFIGVICVKDIFVLFE